MSTTVLGIRVNADTNGAVTGLNNLNRTLDQTDQAVGSAGTTVQNFSRVISDAPFGIIGVANNIEPLIQSFTQLKAQTGSTGGAFKALLGQLAGGGGLMLGVSLLTSALTVLSMNGFFKSAEAADEAGKAAKQYRDELHSIAAEVGRQASDTATLVAALKSETVAREQKLAIIKRLRDINPEIFEGLRIETGQVVGLDNAYKRYLGTLKNSYTAKILQARLDKEFTRLIELEGAAKTKSERGNRRLTEFYSGVSDEALNAANATSKLTRNTLNFANSLDPIIATKGRIEEIQKALAELGGQVVNDLNIDVPEVKVKPEKVKIEKPVRPATLSFADILNITIDDDEAMAAKLATLKKLTETWQRKVVQPVEFPFKPILLTDKNVIRAEEEAKKFGEFMNGVVLDSFVQLGENIGTALGEGGNFFSGFLRILGAGIRQIGVYLVTTAKLIEKIKNALFTKPALAIGLGVGLIAFGSLISAAGRSRSVPGFAKGVNNFRGGLALVGEQGPELVRLPTGSDVIPNNRIGDMAGTINNTFGVQDIVIDGYKLRIVLDRANQSYNRNF